jgi:hypothetical protein
VAAHTDCDSKRSSVKKSRRVAEATRRKWDS